MTDDNPQIKDLLNVLGQTQRNMVQMYDRPRYLTNYNSFSLGIIAANACMNVEILKLIMPNE